MSMSIITVFGGSRAPEGSAAYQEAHELGRQLALAGYDVASGGYQGTMEALSRGAAEAGGHVIGVTSAIFDPLAPSPWLTEERKTPDLHARLQTMTSIGDAFIALRGGVGTLTEVMLAWSLLQTGQLSPRPFILLGENWRGMVDALVHHTDMGSSILALAQVVGTVEEAISLLREWDHVGAGLAPAPEGDRKGSSHPLEKTLPMPMRPPA